ncbi:hypothetical protein FGSG_03671 [Fusarium graminearum PH-1]|uniref:hypothetical protein n=1 Tax=Gibberella zeae (strain ATCC MYA-4620 / CBS 123657 / FGSC 9075 / NRRL 31084 / PH-1) TaxID=229533 RepID=UPI00021F1960|nr:hypothetical protein FGSG_03671 [Fusarium graminearum PH-1]ESU09526.1 hypothetical protein FGSG_03671 [Fusarium graminearum PH-1]|eukprot:XP_011322025.1 hypothetical protein FGSG_03671 [Fusarium graminearum PH-1]
MSSPYQPKQVTQYEASHLIELMGNVSETIIDYSLNLLPPFKSTDLIHDNACGAGVVSQAIMAKIPPSAEGLCIQATDINPQFVTGCEQMAKLNRWPLDAHVMDARVSFNPIMLKNAVLIMDQDLDFSTNHFSHSFNNFAFHSMDVARHGLKEVHRTLKPGGMAMVSTWNEMPHTDALKHANRRTRGENAPLPMLLQDMSFEEEHMRKALQDAGFDPEKTKIYHKDASVTIPDLRRWAQLAWSYLGVLPTGWLHEDEEKWEEALDDIVEQLVNSDGISKNDRGETVMRFAGCVAIAAKEG